MESEKQPTAPATQHGGSSGSGVQRSDVASPVVTRPADEKLPEAPDVEMDGEDSCEAQTGGDDHGSGYVRTGGPRRRLQRGCRDTTNLGGMSGVSTTDEDVAAPEVTEELNRLKLLGRQFTAQTANELMPRAPVYMSHILVHLCPRCARLPARALEWI